jgi:hypothetical protein
VFEAAFARWIDRDGRAEFTDHFDNAVSEITAHVARLVTRSARDLEKPRELIESYRHPARHEEGAPVADEDAAPPVRLPRRGSSSG